MADTLRFLRRQKRLSIRRVALGTGLDRETIRCLENGRTKDPRLTALWALASFYKVTLDELVGRRAG
jgi:transcriptional regulator with XRE-family HTH domain